jgi:hypothetical protein
MRPRSILTIGPSTLLPLRGLCRISLLTVILLVGCAPAATPTLVQLETPAQPAATATELPVEPFPLSTEAQPTVAVGEALPTETPTEVPQPIATSRGPELEATDPATVSLNSGELQLVEFFRFT